MKRALLVGGSGLLLVALVAVYNVLGEDKGAAPSTEAIDRTRKTVRMLDDVYKTAVVLITDKYVNEAGDFPAGSAAIALFSAIEKKGWHEVRLLDVSGEPYNARNVARDEFEKQGVAQLKAGKEYFEQVTEKNGKPYLRAMTPVPVVMQKCVMCHPNYEDAKKGAAIGALSYTVPIE